MDDDILEALDAEQQVLLGTVDALEEASLSSPSRCEGWSVADVLLHLAQTNELAAASAVEGFSEAVSTGPDTASAQDVDEWAAAAVAAERSGGPMESRRRWVESASDQLEAFRRIGASTRVSWVSGELAARSLATTRLAETWIHSDDIAVAIGTRSQPTGRLWHIARLAHRTLPYTFERAGEELDGEVAFVLDAPDGTQWTFGRPSAATVIRGSALQLCETAGQRARADETSLRGDGPYAGRTLALVRTFA